MHDSPEQLQESLFRAFKQLRSCECVKTPSGFRLSIDHVIRRRPPEELWDSNKERLGKTLSSLLPHSGIEKPPPQEAADSVWNIFGTCDSIIVLATHGKIHGIAALKKNLISGHSEGDKTKFPLPLITAVFTSSGSVRPHIEDQLRDAVRGDRFTSSERVYEALDLVAQGAIPHLGVPDPETGVRLLQGQDYLDELNATTTIKIPRVFKSFEKRPHVYSESDMVNKEILKSPEIEEARNDVLYELRKSAAFPDTGEDHAISEEFLNTKDDNGARIDGDLIPVTREFAAARGLLPREGVNDIDDRIRRAQATLDNKAPGRFVIIQLCLYKYFRPYDRRSYYRPHSPRAERERLSQSFGAVLGTDKKAWGVLEDGRTGEEAYGGEIPYFTKEPGKEGWSFDGISSEEEIVESIAARKARGKKTIIADIFGQALFGFDAKEDVSLAATGLDPRTLPPEISSRLKNNTQFFPGDFLAKGKDAPLQKMLETLDALIENGHELDTSFYRPRGGNKFGQDLEPFYYIMYDRILRSLYSRHATNSRMNIELTFMSRSAIESFKSIFLENNEQGTPRQRIPGLRLTQKIINGTEYPIFKLEKLEGAPPQLPSLRELLETRHDFKRMSGIRPMKRGARPGSPAFDEYLNQFWDARKKK